MTDSSSGNTRMVFRVELPETREGPYASGLMGYDFGCQSFRHPLPWDDGLPPRTSLSGKAIFFGFASMVALAKWFNHEERRAMGEKGFKLYVYEVPGDMVVEGRRQLIFHRPGYQYPALVFDLKTSVCDIAKAVLEHRCNVAAAA